MCLGFGMYYGTLFNDTLSTTDVVWPRMTVVTTRALKKATDRGLVYDYATLITRKYSGKQRNIDRERNYYA